MLQEFLGAEKRASYVGAQLKVIFTQGPCRVHGIKTAHLLDPYREYADQPGHIFLPLRRKNEKLLLRKPQRGQQRRTLFGVLGDYRLKLVQRFFSELYL